MMTRCWLLLVLVAALARESSGARLAGLLANAEPAAPAAAAEPHTGRELLQTAAKCNATILGCESCRFVRFEGTVTRALCTRCATGYAIKNSGRNCWCAPGFYWDQANSTWQCVPCGADSYCPGARITQVSGALRVPCGANKVTTTLYARSDRECSVRPGYGWAAGDYSEPCPIGTYNPGYNTRRCSLCPGDLTTAAEASTSQDQCVAPEGSYYLRGRAIFCARGTYKADLGSEDCDRCPDGFTTAWGEVGKTSPDDCKYLLPGYYAPAGLPLGNTSAERCPEDTYRAGDVLYDAENGHNCTACPTNMVTFVDGATTENACLVPPGYGYDHSTLSAYECPNGTFNEGRNRRDCLLCGLGSITTDGPGKSKPDDCYTPAGHMAYKDYDGMNYIGEICPVGTFGSPTSTYGQVAVSCMNCPDGMTTAEEGSTNSDQCYTLPGYGYISGGAFECEFGYWSAGGGHDPCNYCGYGYNTTAGGSLLGPGITGSSNGSDCVLAQGYTLQASGAILACPQGSFKPLYGPGECTLCPNGTTTTLIGAATSLGDCDACLAGYGSDGRIDAAAPACSPCTSGFYSSGHVSGGDACKRCPAAPQFTGDMVSRTGTWTPEDCFPEFNTDAAQNTSHNTWDFIPMAAAALTPAAPTSEDGCQAACAASGDCQYYEFRSSPAPACLLRNTVAYDAALDVTDVSRSYVLFEFAAGRYAAYAAHPTDGASLGQPLGAYAARDAALAACNANAACVGAKFVHTETTNPWRTFGGTKWEGVTGKVRVVGEAIEPWVAMKGPDGISDA